MEAFTKVQKAYITKRISKIALKIIESIEVESFGITEEGFAELLEFINEINADMPDGEAPKVSDNEQDGNVCFGCKRALHVPDTKNIKCLECISGDEKQT